MNEVDDQRVSLIPVFLQEAESKIPVIESFLAERTGYADHQALSEAYRAAHTLKGTAGLVRAEDVRALALRIETNLEKHLERHSTPAPAEYEALDLALGKLKALIGTMKATGTVPETTDLSKIERALDLAEAFPGRVQPLAQSQTPQQPDPFADDDSFAALEEVLPDTGDDVWGESAVVPENDPFAEDASLDWSVRPSHDMSHDRDPFAEDASFDRLGVETGGGVPENAHISASAGQLNRKAPDLRYCCFGLGGQNFSLPIDYMVEICDLPDVSELPLAPPYVHGMANLRGEAIPVVDLCGCAGNPSLPMVNRRMVVAEVSHERLAFLCDGIPELAAESVGQVVDLREFLQRYRLGVH